MSNTISKEKVRQYFTVIIKEEFKLLDTMQQGIKYIGLTPGKVRTRINAYRRIRTDILEL